MAGARTEGGAKGRELRWCRPGERRQGGGRRGEREGADVGTKVDLGGRTVDDEFEGGLAVGGAAYIVQLVVGKSLVQGGLTILEQRPALLVLVRNLQLGGRVRENTNERELALTAVKINSRIASPLRAYVMMIFK
jgi:hypothetical protein